MNPRPKRIRVCATFSLVHRAHCRLSVRNVFVNDATASYAAIFRLVPGCIDQVRQAVLSLLIHGAGKTAVPPCTSTLLLQLTPVEPLWIPSQEPINVGAKILEQW